MFGDSMDGIVIIGDDDEVWFGSYCVVGSVFVGIVFGGFLLGYFGSGVVLKGCGKFFVEGVFVCFGWVLYDGELMCYEGVFLWECCELVVFGGCWFGL